MKTLLFTLTFTFTFLFASSALAARSSHIKTCSNCTYDKAESIATHVAWFRSGPLSNVYVLDPINETTYGFLTRSRFDKEGIEIHYVVPTSVPPDMASAAENYYQEYRKYLADLRAIGLTINHINYKTTIDVNFTHRKDLNGFEIINNSAMRGQLFKEILGGRDFHTITAREFINVWNKLSDVIKGPVDLTTLKISFKVRLPDGAFIIFDVDLEREALDVKSFKDEAGNDVPLNRSQLSNGMNFLVRDKVHMKFLRAQIDRVGSIRTTRVRTCRTSILQLPGKTLVTYICK